MRWRHGGEADDVGEVDGHGVVALSVHAFALRPKDIQVFYVACTRESLLKGKALYC
jgi:hypothetical protein